MGTILTGVTLAEAGKCIFCNTEEVTQGARLCSACALNELRIHLQNPAIRDLLRNVVDGLSLDEALRLLQERADQALKLDDSKTISEDVVTCLDILMKQATQLKNRIVAVPCKVVQLKPDECSYGIEPSIILVKFVLVSNDTKSGSDFTLDPSWVYSVTRDMGVERYKICQTLKRITTSEDVQKVLNILNDILTRVDGHGFYVVGESQLCEL